MSSIDPIEFGKVLATVKNIDKNVTEIKGMSEDHGERITKLETNEKVIKGKFSAIKWLLGITATIFTLIGAFIKWMFA